MERESGTILIVDDNKVNRLLLSRAVEDQGYTPAFAENGLQALQMMHSCRYDVVLLDVVMPEMDGYAHRMYTPGLSELERTQAERQFKADLRKHVDDIGSKYIIAGETSDGAVMFVPAEAVFAEIHAYHRDVIDHAFAKHVWIVSPTTLMAVLNTARAVIKDVETRRQVHVIKDALGKLAKDFSRFDERMRKLADHIRQAHEDAERVHVSSAKITQRFAQIESVEFEHPQSGAPELLESVAESGLEAERQAR